MPKQKPELLLTNGEIITVDNNFTVASSILVRGNRIKAVGDDSINALADPNCKKIDLRGACVLPGQVDAYSHFIISGLDLIEGSGKVNITKLDSVDAILKAISKQLQSKHPGEWIGTSCMFRGELREGRWPNREDLDRIAPDNPVYIMQGGRPIIANSAALRLARIDQNTPDPKHPAGVIGRDDDGELTGQLIAGAADNARRQWTKNMEFGPEEWDFLFSDREQLIKGLLAQQKVFHACGVTATRDIGTVRREINAYVEARRRDLLRIRTRLMLIIPERYIQTEEEFERVYKSYFQPWELGDEMLGLQGVAIDYALDGWQMVTKEQLHRLVTEGNRLNWTMAVTPGNGGEHLVDDVLDILEEAHSENALTHRRFPVPHPMGAREPQQLERFRELDVVLNPNPLLNYHAAARSVKMFEVVKRTGLLQSKAADGMAQAAEMWGICTRDWLEHDLRVSAGSNTPAAIYDEEKPFLGHYALLTGETSVGQLLPNQSISREDMIRIFTKNGAYALRLEHLIGSLEPGKAADLVVVDKNLMTCREDEIATARVEASYMNGELVYER